MTVAKQPQWKSRTPSDTLAPKRARFVAEYLVDLNGKQAAIRAGYSPKTAHAEASRLLNDVKVKTALYAAMAARSERTQITADRVLQELAAIGFSDVRHYALDAVSGVGLREGAPDAAARVIASVKRRVRTDEDGNTTEDVEFRMWDKNTALANLGKHLGLFTDRVEVTGPDGAPIPMSLAVRFVKPSSPTDG